jgi:hypothetical protein
MNPRSGDRLCSYCSFFSHEAVAEHGSMTEQRSLLGNLYLSHQISFPPHCFALSPQQN